MPDIVLDGGISKIIKIRSLISRSLLSNGVNRCAPDDYSKIWILLSSISQPWHYWWLGWIVLCCEAPPSVAWNVQRRPWPSLSGCQEQTSSVPTPTASRHWQVVLGGEIMPGCEPPCQKHRQSIVEAQRRESFYLAKSEKGCRSWVLEFIPATNILNIYCVLSVWLCTKVNRSFPTGGKQMYVKPYDVFRDHRVFAICALWHVGWTAKKWSQRAKDDQ